tara:strand:- start:260 stop:454 length:195 start_codon:yes stop_codon:yes gene_type:complete
LSIAWDTIFGLVLVYVALLLPIAVWVMTDFFAGIPKELDEMAMTNGCSPIGVFFGSFCLIQCQV